MLEELINACNKHKKVAFELKEISENQKKKLREYREMNSKLYEDIADLEVDIKEKEDFTNKLRKQRNSLENEVNHLNENIEKKNEDILQMEFSFTKQKEISSDMVKAIGLENDDLKEQLDAAHTRIETLEEDMKSKVIKEISMEREIMAEIKSLEEEVKNLQEINKMKEEALKVIEEEKKGLDDEIQLLQFVTKVDTPRKGETNEAGTVKSLKDELEDCPRDENLLTVFQCKVCDEDFSTKANLKKHMKDVHISDASLKLEKIQKTVANQTQKLAATINDLMKQEISKLKEPCSCKRFCNISHLKHNWKKHFSTDFMASFGEIKNGGGEDGEVYSI